MKMIGFGVLFAIIKMQTTKIRQITLKSVRDGAQRREKLMLAEERFGQILDLLNKVHSGAILTNRCPDPKYKQYTLVKETEL